MKIFFKPTMLFLSIFIVTIGSCNNEELFIEDSLIAEETPIKGEENNTNNEDVFQNVVLQDDIYDTNEDTVIVISPYVNDENIPIEFSLTYTNPSNGVVIIDNNETPDNIVDDIIRYSPNPGFFGIDTFEYTLCDSVNIENCDTALVTINVVPKIEDDIATELKAFPTAYGAGANASGGRGGKVIHVTTLNWTGSGSLKEALQTSGPRIIVFDVSGEIDATSQSDFNSIIEGSNYDNLTIAGQTAPHGGISIRTSEFMFKDVNNIIIRYIRFRNLGVTQDAQWFINTSNVIFDHCTFSHGGDESASISSSSGIQTNFTYQRCFFQDSKTGSIMGVDGGIGEYSAIYNVYSNISHRFPNTKGLGRYDIVNNIVYNWKARLSRFQEGGKINLINNYYKPSKKGLRQSAWYGLGSTKKAQHKISVKNNPINYPIVYASGSIVVGERETPKTDDSDMFTAFFGSDIPEYSPVPDKYFTNTQYAINGANYNIMSAKEAYVNVLNDVGANKTLNADGTINYYQDTKDATDIMMIKDDSYSGNFYDERSTIAYPEIPQNIRASNYDTDGDGMPDLWEKANYGDLSKDGKADTDGDGYTDLEEFLNQVDK